MQLELITHATSFGDITKQKLIIDQVPYEIHDLDIWEGEQMRIGMKLYDLILHDSSHGNGLHDDIFHYKLEEVEEYDVKDATSIVSSLIGENQFKKYFSK